MTINYTTLLGLAQPVTGTETGQWGDVVNDEITSLLEDAVANAATISVTSGNVTLTTTNGSSNQARMSTLIITGTPGTTRNVIAPSQSKIYVVINQSDSSVVIKGSATTGITVAAGQTAQVAWNGSDFVEIGNYVNGSFVVNGNLTVKGNTSLGDSTSDTLSVTALVNSNLLFTDATYDIGASGATRPRNLYLSGLLTMGGALTVNGSTTLGDASADNLTVNATITSNLLFTDNTYDIGAASTTRPRYIYTAGGIGVNGAIASGDTVTINNGRFSVTNSSSNNAILRAKNTSYTVDFGADTSGGYIDAGGGSIRMYNGSTLLSTLKADSQFYVNVPNGSIYDENGGSDVGIFYTMIASSPGSGGTSSSSLNSGATNAGFSSHILNSASKRITVAIVQTEGAVTTAGSESSNLAFKLKPSATSASASQQFFLTSTGNAGFNVASAPANVTGSAYGAPWGVLQYYSAGDAVIIANGATGAGRLHLVNGAAASGSKNWFIEAVSSSLVFTAATDGLNSSVDAIAIARTGAINYKTTATSGGQYTFLNSALSGASGTQSLSLLIGKATSSGNSLVAGWVTGTTQTYGLLEVYGQAQPLVLQSAIGSQVGIGGYPASGVNLHVQGGSSGLMRVSGTSQATIQIGVTNGYALIYNPSGIGSLDMNYDAPLGAGTNVNRFYSNGTVFLGGSGSVSSGYQVEVNGKIKASNLDGPSFSATMGGSTQTISATSRTKLAFGTEEWDTASAYNTSTYRFTPQVAGYYQVDITVVTANQATTGDETIVFLYRNGIEYGWSNNTLVSNIHYNSFVNPRLIFLNGSTDYLEVYLYNGSSSSLTVNPAGGSYPCFFSAFLARAS